jgi:integrase
MTEQRKRRRQGRRQFGGVERLPSGRYRASYRGPDGNRRVGPTTFATVADADRWLNTISTDITRGDWRPPEPARELFGAYARAWLTLGVSRQGEPLSPTTRELYAGLWRLWIEPTFADVALGDLTMEMVRTWLATAKLDHPGSTQPDKAYRLLRVILNVAVDDEKIKVNPCRVKGGGRESSPERPVVMPNDVLRIAEEIGPEYRAMVIVAAWCSLRFGELAGLRRARVDLLHRKIDVCEQAVDIGSRVIFKEPKWDSRRVVDVPGEVVALLEEHLAERVGSGADSLVFTSPEGHPLRRTKFRPKWANACAGAGVTDIHFHDLRGSGATWAAHQGATLAELMQRLGHRTHTAALRYQHATSERGREIADRLGALMQAASEVQPDQANLRPIRSVVE